MPGASIVDSPRSRFDFGAFVRELEALQRALVFARGERRAGPLRRPGLLDLPGDDRLLLLVEEVDGGPRLVLDVVAAEPLDNQRTPLPEIVGPDDSALENDVGVLLQTRDLV